MKNRMPAHKRAAHQLNARFSPTATFGGLGPTETLELPPPPTQPPDTPQTQANPFTFGLPFTLFPPDTTTQVQQSIIPTPPVNDPATQQQATPTSPSAPPPPASSSTLVTDTSTLVTDTASSAVPPPPPQAPTSSASSAPGADAKPTSQGTKATGPNAVVTETGTIIRSLSAGTPSAAAASTTPTIPAATTSKGAVAGGVTAAVLAAVGIFVLFFYLLRRCKKASSEDNFDSDEFRRKSTMIPEGSAPSPRPWDQPTVPGQHPRPPTMIERQMAATPATMAGRGAGLGYNHPPSPGPFAAYNGFNNGDAAQQGYNGDAYYMGNGPHAQHNGPSFLPGDVIFAPDASSLPPSAAPGQLYFANGPHNYDAPLPSPVQSSVDHYDSAYNAQGELRRAPSAGPVQPGAYLSRAPSAAGPGQPGGAYLTRAPSTGPAPVPQDASHYVDLNRSSVTPFQARQYEEITRQLSVPAPPMLNDVHEEDSQDGMSPAQSPVHPQFLPVQRPALEHALPESPFADPHMHHAAASFSPSMSDDEEDDGEEVHALEAPQPAFAERERITSTPPSLPEMERAFSPVMMDAAQFNFPLPTTGAAASGPEPAPAGAPPAANAVGTDEFAVAPRTPRPDAAEKRPQTLYTVYDPEDAYGGI